jgi:hypothetical protein
MVFTINKMNDVLTQFVREDHPYLFVEHSYDKCPMCDTVRDALSPYYTLKETEGFLDVYQKN